MYFIITEVIGGWFLFTPLPGVIMSAIRLLSHVKAYLSLTARGSGGYFYACTLL